MQLIRSRVLGAAKRLRILRLAGQPRGLLTDVAQRHAVTGESAHAPADGRAPTHPPPVSPSFSRVPNVLSTAAAEAAHFGSVRRAWRPLLEWLHAVPGLQRVALETASYFTAPHEIEFHLPRTFHATYALAEVLGEGAFGRVHRVVPVDARVDLELAVKVISKQRIVNLTDYQALQQEGRMMVLLGGTLNVVHFFGAYEDDANVYLVMEHCVGGDASTRLLQQAASDSDASVQVPSEPLVAGYMADILHVVWQCHLLRILHGDLKLENFLFADDKPASPLKLTDFGGASFLHDGEMLFDVRGTPLYTAPEVLRAGNGYSFPSDMWSCGVILYRLLAGRFPFEGGALLDERILHEELDFDSPPWQSISDDAKQLVRGLLTRDSDARLTAEQALHHPWIRTASCGSSSCASSVSTDPARATAPPPLPLPLLNGTMVQRLQLYRALNSFQQAVFVEIARLLPLEIKEDVVVLFSEIATPVVSANGATSAARVGLGEFAAALERGGYRVTLGEVKSFLSRLDLDGDGQLSLDEFCAAFLDWSVIQRAAPERWRGVVTRVFNTLDVDGDGLLGVDDLARLAPFGELDGFSSTHRHSFRSDLQRCFRHADLDNNGVIDRHEFQSMLHMQLRAYEHFATRVAPPRARLK